MPLGGLVPAGAGTFLKNVLGDPDALPGVGFGPPATCW